jgi:hypothetical protein
MRRLLPLLLLPVLAASSLALADGPEQAPSPAERLRRFRQERALVHKLVEGGLVLARKTEPLERAEECNRLAKDLTAEIQRAVEAKDRTRAGRLSLRLEALLVKGVAGNLNRAPESSPAHRRRLALEAIAVTDPLRDALDSAPDLEQKQLEGVVQAVSQGRAELEKALRDAPDKGRPKLKAPPVGKKLKKD